MKAQPALARNEPLPADLISEGLAARENLRNASKGGT